MSNLIPRRRFLANVFTFLGALLLSGQRTVAAALTKGSELIRHWGSPNILETPLAELGKSWLTPNRLFYVLSREALRFSPEVRKEWRVKIEGEISRPIRLSLAEIRRRFEWTEFPAYLQCAGNGRKFFRPPIEDVTWGYGAIGNARWGGIRLADILRQIGLRPDAKHTAFAGQDASPEHPDSYIKSIPLEKALNPHTILALTMNGEPLPEEHGGPVRLLVPGWAGTYSVKWLTHIIALKKPWDGFWMNQAYRVDGQAFTEFSLNSAITQPADGEVLTLDKIISLEGVAWTGEAEVVGVEISLDGGKTWQEAELGRERAKYAWRKWSFVWRPTKAESYTLLAKARDSRGRVQPLVPKNWNPGGYGWNAAIPVRVKVR